MKSYLYHYVWYSGYKKKLILSVTYQCISIPGHLPRFGGLQRRQQLHLRPRPRVLPAQPAAGEELLHHGSGGVQGDRVGRAVDGGGNAWV